MFRIGEFSRLTQVSVRMLRYYDENGLLKPADINIATGYRLYSAAQIPRLNRIIFLRDAGFGVTEMADLLDNWDEALVARRFEEKKAEISAAIRAEEDKLARLSLALEGARQGGGGFLHYDVAIRSVPSWPVLSLRRRIPDYYAEGALWKEMGAFAEKHKIPLSGETFTNYHDPDYRERDVDVELCAHTAEMGEDAEGFTFRHTEAAPQMACTMVYGPFERIAGAFRSFAGWLDAHSQYRMGKTSRQIVHRGPWNEEDPEQFLTEIQIPLDPHTV